MKKVILFFFIQIISVSLFSNPILESLVYKIRDPDTDKKEFREYLEKIGEYVAIDVAKDLNTKKQNIETVMQVKAEHNFVDEEIVLVTILRAGLPLFNGVFKVFPEAEAGFFAMQRNEKTLKASVDYVALPPIDNKTVIIADTMLATGGSMLDAIKIVEKRNPKKIILISAIAAQEGIDNILKHNPDIEIYPAYVDPILNEVGYIVPGLGDAGDRCYGNKITVSH
ncbi:MAG: Uracil phosphoribosyltransferase [Candidatus Anoxychlamydiales bacterium]|nr:Uracil phosphoribosyltransferase [Candidatus Anoxychlamydiales bacterium]